jgi:hypothetical protein
MRAGRIQLSVLIRVIRCVRTLIVRIGSPITRINADSQGCNSNRTQRDELIFVSDVLVIADSGFVIRAHPRNPRFHCYSIRTLPRITLINTDGRSDGTRHPDAMRTDACFPSSVNIRVIRGVRAAIVGMDRRLRRSTRMLRTGLCGKKIRLG